MKIEAFTREDGSIFEISTSSENLWKDLGRPDAAEHFAKVKLVAEIDRISKNRELSTRKLAEILEADHGQLSKLLRGRNRGYLLDRLIGYLNKLGMDVEIQLTVKHLGRRA